MHLISLMTFKFSLKNNCPETRTFLQKNLRLIVSCFFLDFHFLLESSNQSSYAVNALWAFWEVYTFEFNVWISDISWHSLFLYIYSIRKFSKLDVLDDSLPHRIMSNELFHCSLNSAKSMRHSSSECTRIKRPRKCVQFENSRKIHQSFMKWHYSSKITRINMRFDQITFLIFSQLMQFFKWFRKWFVSRCYFEPVDVACLQQLEPNQAYKNARIHTQHSWNHSTGEIARFFYKYMNTADSCIGKLYNRWLIQSHYSLHTIRGTVLYDRTIPIRHSFFNLR